MLLLNGALLSTGQAKQVNSPGALVRAFQQDYLTWNNHAFALHDTHAPAQVMPLAQKSWDRLLTKYTLPGFKGEPIAFGSDAAHDPQCEQILSVKVHDNKAVVTTRFPQTYYTSVYEYHLMSQHHRWYLTQIYLVDDSGKYPSL
ncbi:hypothetical protein [Photorhabdus luminescens]|uniref:hypothetical protein n=1 Tax=Photorhabdus luminescens TaxID=29488 RepID=UPI001F00ABD8|nr:hypothetical protein [Photorhabdus luminescens]